MDFNKFAFSRTFYRNVKIVDLLILQSPSAKFGSFWNIL